MNTVVAAVIIALLVCNLIGLVVVGLRVGRQSGDARELERRITKLEARVDNLPTHTDLKELGRGITAAAEGLASLTGQTQTMTHMLRTIQEHLLDNEGPRR